MTGKFITVEGVEGVGKSTNMAFIHQWLEKREIPHILTREPGGTAYAEQIRSLLLSTEQGESVDDMTELLLIFAARAQHLAQVIKPALQAGKWVLCDRFTDATYAYQGGGRGIAMDRIAELENLVQDDLRPDLVLVLDIEPEIGLQRALQRSGPDRFEQEKVDFFKRVRDVYLRRAKQDPAHYQVIDAAQRLEQVQADIEKVLQGI